MKFGVRSIERRGKRERFADDGLLDPSAANALCAHAARHHRAPILDLNPLQVGPELPARDSGRFATVAPQVLGLAALRNLIA